MLFNSPEFAVFFLAVLFAYRALPAPSRNTALLVASLLFYMLWIPEYLVVLGLDIVVNYVLLRAMLRSTRPALYLSAALIFSLGVLAYYKYAAFLVTQALPVFDRLGAEVAVPEVFLPLGISFFTFQILALTIDCYREPLEPPRSFREYALFIAFFPQLIAGPILRGWQFLPQLRRGGRMDAERDRRALWLIATGLAKKVLLADLLLAPYVDGVFYAPGQQPAAAHLLAVYSFAFQIYFDFSGYTDMARGLALLLGFDLPANFREPYLSRNPAEFWRRWHITLSRWLRDYLYIPLGGNRASPLRVRGNLLVTMLLGGLWHGAGWNFVIWGGLHGLLLIGHRLLARGETHSERPLAWSDLPRILLCFHAVCFLWIFFRAPSFLEARLVIEQLFTGSYAGGWPVFQIGVVLLCAGLHVFERSARAHLAIIRARLGGASGRFVEGFAFGTLVGLCALFGGAGTEFIYFQF